jgi:hypothetical protein
MGGAPVASVAAAAGKDIVQMPNAERASALAAGLAMLLVLGCGVPLARANNVPDLYRAKTLVTGQTAAGRGPALVRCLADVLVKVSGDPRLLGEGDAATLTGPAAALVREFHYRDLMAGLPIHDEQGTRDRPYELTAVFDPAGVEALLQTLGRKPWTGPRPRVAVFLAVRHGTLAYELTGDGDRGATMREALQDAAGRVGLPVVLPSAAALTHPGWRPDRWLVDDDRVLDAAARRAGGDVALAGRLVWSEQALGWIADWRIVAQGRTYRWQLRGVSFDAAFRSAMRGALQVLSGHGSPK